jgi:hypothetical protein
MGSTRFDKKQLIETKMLKALKEIEWRLARFSLKVNHRTNVSSDDRRDGLYAI